jgi:PAS domain S-box-containing protein
MPRSQKYDERTEQVHRENKKTTSAEPLRPQPKQLSELRRRAEKVAEDRIAKHSIKTVDDIPRLIHDLEVHQIELEMQNEEMHRTYKDLEDSRNKYSNLYDLAPVGYFTLNKEGLIVGANLTGAAFLGEERNNLLKSKFSHFITPGSQDEFYLHHRQVIERGTRQSCELKLRRKYGTEFHAQLVSVAVAEQKGEYDQFRMTMTDITERKKAEERLQEESNLLRTLIDHIPDKVYVKDRGSRFIACNKSTIASNGVKKEEELIGKTDFDLYEQALAQQFFDKEQELMRTGRPIIDCEIPASDGSAHCMLVTKVPLRDHSGNIVGMVGINRDITEHKLAEKRLQNERNLLRTLIDHIPSEVYVKDKESRFVLCNKALAECWKRDGKDNIIGKTDFDLFEHEIAQQFFDEEQNLMQTGRSIINSEGRHISKSGEVFYGSTNKVPLRDSTGNITGLVGINYDITECKQAEQKINEYQKHLKQLAARLTLTEERERRRIAGEIHDEISQTLAIVNIKLDTLRNSPPFEASATEIEEISSSVEKVIQETRTLTFELSNPILYELGFETAVAEWLDEQVQVKHGIATEFQDDGKPKPLDNDMRVLLFRNARELLINCIKHANAGKVRVNIRRIDGSIEVVVEDNGVGFDPAEARSIAGKKAKFGLFSVRESLEHLGGHFIIESKPGAGCKAIMTAPLKDQSHK